MSDVTERPGPADELPTRRDLLDHLLILGSAVSVVGCMIPAACFLWPARERGPGSEFGSAGKVSDFAVGAEKMISIAGKPVMVLRVREDEYRAFSAICTHLACIVRWDPQSRQVRCPCHAGFFDTEGKVISGPPPRPLTPYRVVVLEDEVRVYP